MKRSARPGSLARARVFHFIAEVVFVSLFDLVLDCEEHGNGDDAREYPFLEDEDIRACITYVRQQVSQEHIEPLAR